MHRCPAWRFHRLVARRKADTELVELWITDLPYADARTTTRSTELFIAWLRKSPPKPFDEWVWIRRRALAIKAR